MRGRTTARNLNEVEERNRTPAALQGKSRRRVPLVEQQRRSCYHCRCPRTQNHEESREEQTKTEEVEHARMSHPERYQEAAEQSKGPEQPQIGAETKNPTRGQWRLMRSLRRGMNE